MKKINIIYWVSTALIALMMLFSAYSSFTNNPQGAKLMADLGYPAYFAAYLGFWKVLGVLALVVPGFPKIREWAYFGFAVDLISATYSFIAIKTPASQWAMIPAFLIILGISYYCNQKRMAATGVREAAV